MDETHDTQPLLLIEFAPPGVLLREADRPSSLPIIGNGPPGTFIAFPAGLRVSLPTDQIVSAEESDGFVRVGFGGMQFIGIENAQLVFARVREVLPEWQLSPARSRRMQLDPSWVAAVFEHGRCVWRTR